MNGAGQPEFGFDAFNPIDEPSEGSVISQAFHGRSERNEMMDNTRATMQMLKAPRAATEGG